MEKCFLCGSIDAEATKESNGMAGLICPTCGHIVYEPIFCGPFLNPTIPLYWNNGIPLNKKEIEKTKIALQNYYKMHTGKPSPLVLTDRTWEDIIATVNYPNSLLDKIDLVLEYIYQKTSYFGEYVDISLEHDYPLFFCEGERELSEILDYLKEAGFVDGECWTSCGDQPTKITTEGIERVEQFGKNFNSEKCFVAMWFSNETKKAWDNAIKISIERAGYIPVRIDELEHIENIVDKIISEIRTSKFIIVDLTGDRGGVYFEAGFAYGLNLPVIYTCKEDSLENVHFDLKQQNMILWNDAEIDKFEEKLFNRIGNIIGFNEKAKVKVSV
jgi:nucleoside 2-deoxyribosyltransferase